VKSGRAKGLGYFEIKNGFKEDMISYRKELFFYTFFMFFLFCLCFFISDLCLSVLFFLFVLLSRHNQSLFLSSRKIMVHVEVVLDSCS
jgi:hypothetical protein